LILTATHAAQIDGLILIDKPTGITSHDVVHRMRRAVKQKSVGHTGTLDPLATGLMILVLGEATKLSDYLLMSDKSYWIKVRLGATSDTLDRTGKILSETGCSLTREQVMAAVEKLQGDFEWPVPLYSAAKIDGKKLYEYGRAGEAIELPKKPMSFWEAQVEEFSGNMLQLKITCSKGSFVRTWADQLGRELGVGGLIEELRRIRVGPFALEQSITLDEAERRGHQPNADFAPAFIPMAQALPSWKALIANSKDARLMSNGQVPRDLENRLVFEQKQAFDTRSPVFVKVMTGGGELLAILAAEPGQGLKIRRVFRTFS
jgi:tRNA pseudouridine55 synthase